MFFVLFFTQISSLLLSAQTLNFFLNISELKSYNQTSVVRNALKTMKYTGWSDANLETMKKLMRYSFGARDIEVQILKAWDPNNEKFLWFGLAAFAIFGLSTFLIFYSLKNSHVDTMAFQPSCDIDLNFTAENLSTYFQGLLGVLNANMIGSLFALLGFSWFFLQRLRLNSAFKLRQHR